MMRRATISMLALIALAACGRKGARRSDFDSATAVALTPDGAAAAVASQPKVAHVSGFNIGHGLDRHDMIFGGAAEQFTPADSILISVRGLYLPAGADVSARIRPKNAPKGATSDSTGAKAPAADTAGVAYIGLRFGPQKKPVKGGYVAEIFLDGKFQMSQEFTIGQ
jgi:hypothetical protein